MISLGGGAVTSAETRALLRSAFVVLIDIDVDSAWERVRRSKRPLAQDEAAFRTLYAEREQLYRDVADAVVADTAGIVLAAAGGHYERGGLDRLGELVPGDGPVALVADSNVMGIYGARAQEALGSRLTTMHELPSARRRRGGEVVRDRDAALARAPPRPRRHRRRARRRLHDRRRRVRGGDLPPRRPVGRRADDAGRPGRRRRSAARRASTSRRARTSSARSTGRRAS